MKKPSASQLTSTQLATKKAKKAESPHERYEQKDQGEDLAIIEVATGKTVALVPYKPFGAANRELYRDRPSQKEAKILAGKILKSLNFFE